jgi:site-specific DNA-cytosine methylase
MVKQILKVGTLFSGIGAPEFALKESNIEHELVYACDNDSYVKSTYLLNHNPNTFYDDIKEVIGKNEKINLLIFGFCCQSWSFAGKRKGLDDERGKLVLTACKILKEQQPEMFIAENVAGLVRQKQDFNKLLKEFDKIGYNVKWRLYNSLNFGIPQHRLRVWFVGIRKDLKKEFIFPEINKKYPPLKSLLNKNVDCKYYATESFLKKEKVQNKLKSASGEYIPCITHTIARNGSSGEYISYVAAVYNAIGEARKPTPEESLALFGFPKTFKFPDNISMCRRYTQIGNTMVIPVLREIIKKLELELEL